jgi:hypothetical protein
VCIGIDAASRLHRRNVTSSPEQLEAGRHIRNSGRTKVDHQPETAARLAAGEV